MKSITFLSWLYDIRLNKQGIRFVLFGFWTIYLLQPSNIKTITEIGSTSIGALNAYNFKNRFFARCFMIETKTGWFTRKILITPNNSNEFIAWLNLNGIEMQS
jgi:hypothetical protein